MIASQRVGVIGGGQLAWMMGKEAPSLGIELIVQTPHPDDPAVSLATEVILAAIDDVEATAKLAKKCDVITFENEFINLDALQPLAQQGVRFSPSLETLAPLLDKYQQRCFLRDIGLPVPPFVAIPADVSSPVNFLDEQGFQFPLVLKARRHGYDGYGTFILAKAKELENLWQRLEQPLMMAEALVTFHKELAVMAARNQQGEIVIYPVVETQQENQVCHRVLVPADIPPAINQEVKQITRHLLEKSQAVGIFGVELFLTDEGKLFVNEIAPRTHNSGHYTLDACITSQFAMQLQAVTGLPLGSSQLKSKSAAMVNLLGYEYSHHDYQAKRAEIAAIEGVYLHWYEKTESRPGRKLGHVTILRDDVTTAPELQPIVKQIESIWYGQVSEKKQESISKI